MKSLNLSITFVACICGIATPALAQKEQKVQMSDLPPIVRQAVERETAGAAIKGLSKEIERGRTLYEAETMVNGHSRDLLVDSAGSVIEVEEQIDPATAPAAVRAALEKKGTLVRLESVKRGGKPLTYEAVVKTKAGKRTEVALNEDGTPVKQ